jgi:polysaccharide export outer membrane protein
MLKPLCQKIGRAALVAGFIAGWAGLSGCQSQPAASHTPSPASHDAQGAAAATPAAPVTNAPDNSPSQALREGDTIHISFPGAPSLDSTQTIRLDGKITLSTVGEMKVAGLTPPELEQQLLKAYDSQLVVKQVSVVLQSSTFVIYVTGAVLRPGKLVSDRVVTPLEAVIEAGIDHDKANLKKVVVIRENENGKTERFKLNLNELFQGKPFEPFTLKPMDKIYVPEKFTWF